MKKQLCFLYHPEKRQKRMKKTLACQVSANWVTQPLLTLSLRDGQVSSSIHGTKLQGRLNRLTHSWHIWLWAKLRLHSTNVATWCLPLLISDCKQTSLCFEIPNTNNSNSSSNSWPPKVCLWPVWLHTQRSLGKLFRRSMPNGKRHQGFASVHMQPIKA